MNQTNGFSQSRFLPFFLSVGFSKLGFSQFPQRVAKIILCATGLTLTAAAHATLITFDDLTPAPCDELHCDALAVTDQYAAQGVIFSGAALESQDSGLTTTSPPNYLTDLYGPGLDIFFTGPKLPTFVSLYVSAFNQDAVYIDAFGPNGAVASWVTDGWQGQDSDAPYRDNQLVTFSGAEISHLNLSEFYNRRGSTTIDNLSFSFDKASVPEPSSIALSMTGFALLLLNRRKKIN
ncbi:MAG: hypothetical protein JWM78_3713 [Verrucomicrobiaceae bacterium]|nr:hypothetical protein [Verrucomicrobiaceae bacterium]